MSSMPRRSRGYRRTEEPVWRTDALRVSTFPCRTQERQPPRLSWRSTRPKRRGRFWDVHEALMERGPALLEDDIARIARDFNLPPRDEMDGPAFAAAQAKVRDDIESAQRTGVEVRPTFFINGRHYAGTWDESSLADAMLAPLGHRIQSAAFEFVRWGPFVGIAPGAGDD